MELSKDDVILAQAELIARQGNIIDKQAVEIGQMKQRVDALVDSVNWYEVKTKHNATFEKLRGELEFVQMENRKLRGVISAVGKV